MFVLEMMHICWPLVPQDQVFSESCNRECIQEVQRKQTPEATKYMQKIHRKYRPKRRPSSLYFQVKISTSEKWIESGNIRIVERVEAFSLEVVLIAISSVL